MNILFYLIMKFMKIVFNEYLLNYFILWSCYLLSNLFIYGLCGVMYELWVLLCYVF